MSLSILRPRTGMFSLLLLLLLLAVVVLLPTSRVRPWRQPTTRARVWSRIHPPRWGIWTVGTTFFCMSLTAVEAARNSRHHSRTLSPSSSLLDSNTSEKDNHDDNDDDNKQATEDTALLSHCLSQTCMWSARRARQDPRQRAQWEFWSAVRVYGCMCCSIILFNFGGGKKLQQRRWNVRMRKRSSRSRRNSRRYARGWWYWRYWTEQMIIFYAKWPSWRRLAFVPPHFPIGATSHRHRHHHGWIIAGARIYDQALQLIFSFSLALHLLLKSKPNGKILRPTKSNPFNS